MKLHELKKNEGATFRKKIVGRGPGSGSGKTSGRGQKGQNARSGGGVSPVFEGGQLPLYRRLPKRGFSNSDFKIRYATINVSDLNEKFKDGDVVRWFFNPTDYIMGVVVEVCGDGTYWVEHSNGQQRHYKESELMMHTEDDE